MLARIAAQPPRRALRRPQMAVTSRFPTDTCSYARCTLYHLTAELKSAICSDQGVKGYPFELESFKGITMSFCNVADRYVALAGVQPADAATVSEIFMAPTHRTAIAGLQSKFALSLRSLLLCHWIAYHRIDSAHVARLCTKLCTGRVSVLLPLLEAIYSSDVAHDT